MRAQTLPRGQGWKSETRNSGHPLSSHAQRIFPLQRYLAMSPPAKTKLLPRQRTFCDGIAAGLTGAEAARQAGYSDARAAATASRLRTHPEIQAGIERRLNGYDPNPAFDDPLQFLMWYASDPEAGAMKHRVDAAIACLPYLHERKH